jgi:hypothetical protein
VDSGAVEGNVMIHHLVQHALTPQPHAAVLSILSPLLPFCTVAALAADGGSKKGK